MRCRRVLLLLLARSASSPALGPSLPAPTWLPGPSAADGTVRTGRSAADRPGSGCGRQQYRRPVEGARAAVEAIRGRALPGAADALGVDVHFHPDAISPGRRSVLEAIVGDGRWRTQFETGTSNGGLTTFPGGDRWRWESRLFGGAYDGADPSERPAYGALRLSDDPYGSAPRFGSAHLRLQTEVLARTTLCFPDSVFEPEAVGTLDRAGAVLDALARVRLDDPLDEYVEAHVHGGIDLQRDVAAIVLDPSFRGTAVEDAAAAGGVPVVWHPGYELAPDRLPSLAAYRGRDVTDAAMRIAGDRALTPASLGRARQADGVDPRLAKWVWHLLAAHGRPA